MCDTHLINPAVRSCCFDKPIVRYKRKEIDWPKPRTELKDFQIVCKSCNKQSKKTDSIEETILFWNNRLLLK